MGKNEIRLQYSGFVIFAAKMITVVTGLIFQFMIARALLPVHKTEYDLWFNLTDITTYFTLLAGVFPFWAGRFVARGKEGATKTGILANLAISMMATLIYLPLVPLITSALGISGIYIPIYFIVSMQIAELYSIAMLESCLQAKIPQTVGYGLLVQQIVKVILGYVLIVQLNQLLLGAVVATISAYAIQLVYYFSRFVSELKQRIKWEYVREWLKGSLANIYNVVGNQIAAYIFIMLLVYGGEGARGRLGAATIIVNVITYSSFLAYALLPKLLAERKGEDITTSLKMVLMFAIPLTAGAIALSDSYIIILTETYRDAAPVLVASAIDAFIMTVSGLFSTILFGVETVDEHSKISMRQLAKSRLFVVFSLPYIHSLITIPAAFFVLTNYAQNQPLQAALSVSIINLTARFAMFLILYIIVRKMVRIDIPWKSLAKYSFAAAVMGAVLFLMPHPTTISLTLGTTAAGGVIYLGILMAIDREARKLPQDILKEVRRK